MAETMEEFSRGDISAGKGLKKVLESREEASGNIDSFEEAQAFRKKQINSTETLVSAMAKGSASVSEFRMALEPSKDSLLKHGLITNKLIEKIEDELQARIKSKKIIRRSSCCKKRRVR